MKVISIINLKGGVGKTVTTIQLADMLTQQGHKVLLVDNDKQGNLSKFYKVYNEHGFEGTARVMIGSTPDINVVRRNTRYEHIDILPTNMNLLSATLTLGKEQTEQHTKLKKLLDTVKSEYDYCIIDNAPDMGLNIVNALMVSNDVIVPLKVDEWSMKGLDIITEQIRQAAQINKNLLFAGALITIFRNNDANNAGVEWLNQNGYKVFKTKIRYSEKIDESIFFHEAINEYSPRSAAAVDYRRFYREYIKRGEINTWQ